MAPKEGGPLRCDFFADNAFYTLTRNADRRLYGVVLSGFMIDGNVERQESSITIRTFPTGAPLP